LRITDRELSAIREAVSTGVAKDESDVIRRALDLWFSVDPDLRRRARETDIDLGPFVLRPGCMTRDAPAAAAG
jgi:Arc/MetJ-type ribon-helix-helix transcriptional regulator